jgi:non-homologous end joining protein Ku
MRANCQGVVSKRTARGRRDVLRQREHVAGVQPPGDALVLSMMRFAHEIRSPNDLDLPKAGEGWTKKEMDLAYQLIDTLADTWKPEEFRDTYTEVLRKAIEAKFRRQRVGGTTRGAPAGRRQSDEGRSSRASLARSRRRRPAEPGVRRSAAPASAPLNGDVRHADCMVGLLEGKDRFHGSRDAQIYGVTARASTADC